MAQAPWWCPWLGAGHCHGGQGPGEGSQDSGTRRGTGPQSRQRRRTDRQTCTQERHQSCKATQTLGRAESWAAPGPPLEQLCSGGPRGDLHPPGLSLPAGGTLSPPRVLERVGVGKVEHGAQLSSRPCQESRGWALGAGRGVSPCGPPSAQGAMHRTAMATPRSSERQREARRGCRGAMRQEVGR